MRLIALFLVAGVSLVAQEITGSISGIVMDPSGAVLPGVQVAVTNTGTNVSKTVTTGPSGAYVVPFLFFGTYRVTAEVKGFKTARAENIRLSTSEQVRVDLTLAVGDVTETVEVTANDVQLKTEEVSISTTVNQEMIVNLPLAGRQIIAATLLTPGHGRTVPSFVPAKHSDRVSSRRTGL